MDHTYAPNVAMQLANMWPHCRSYVTPTPTGYAVTFGSVAAELTPSGTTDWIACSGMTFLSRSRTVRVTYGPPRPNRITANL